MPVYPLDSGPLGTRTRVLLTTVSPAPSGRLGQERKRDDFELLSQCPRGASTTDTVSVPTPPQQTQLPSKSPLPAGQPQAPRGSPTLFSKPPTTTIPTPGHSPGSVLPATEDHLILLQHPRPLGAHVQAHGGQVFGDPQVWELPHDPLQVHLQICKHDKIAQTHTHQSQRPGVLNYCR